MRKIPHSVQGRQRSAQRARTLAKLGKAALVAVTIGATLSWAALLLTR